MFNFIRNLFHRIPVRRGKAGSTVRLSITALESRDAMSSTSLLSASGLMSSSRTSSGLLTMDPVIASPILTPKYLPPAESRTVLFTPPPFSSPGVITFTPTPAVPVAVMGPQPILGTPTSTYQGAIDRAVLDRARSILNIPKIDTTPFVPPPVTASLVGGVLRIDGADRVYRQIVSQNRFGGLTTDLRQVGVDDDIRVSIDGENFVTVQSRGQTIQINVGGTNLTRVLGTSVRRIVVDGKAGNDTIDLSSIVSNLPITCEIHGGDDTDVLKGAPNLRNEIHGGFGYDTITGGNLNDSLWGDDHDDIIVGGAGDDTLFGGWGADTLDGGTGTDQLYGEGGNDNLRFSADDVWASKSKTTSGIDISGMPQTFDYYDGGADYDRLELLDVSTAFYLNSPYEDEFTGFSPSTAYAVEQIDGKGGNDVIDVSYSRNWSPFVIHGGAGNDRLVGGSGSDKLYGGEGNDSLFGGAKADRDTLDGGAGADRFLVMFREDTVSDLRPEDARITFTADGNKFWTNEEVVVVDNGLAFLHNLTNNTRLLKLKSGGEIEVQRVVSLGENIGGDNDSNGHIRMTDVGLTRDPAKTMVHEIGHNWDDESPYWPEFLGLSNWKQRSWWDKIFATGSRPGISEDFNWTYNVNAQFYRDYSKENPMEDWATSWEAYYYAKTNPTPANLAKFNLLKPKMDMLEKFFASMK